MLDPEQAGRLWGPSLALWLTVSLVTDRLLLASRNAFDVAIICAMDADFFRAVEGVKEMGKEAYIASFDDSCATKLKDASLGYFLNNALRQI